jgi:8-oxo-dGTP pyrophosphatase MutT (NUDIX family)
MKQTTLCFLLKDDTVLLAMKKRGFGAGKWNGVGGKVAEGEDVIAAAIREIKEEIGVTVATEDLSLVGTLDFDFSDNHEWAQTCSVFIARRWEGEPAESEEMRPQWYPKNELPFGGMWIDDPHWLPLVLAGKRIKGKFLFEDQGGSMINFAVSEIHS